MKKYIYYILSLLFLTISACTGMEEFDETIPGDDAVIFSLRTTAGVVTRSEDTSVEEKMAKIDVFFVTEGGAVYYHEQVLNEESDPVYKQGEFTLIKRRSEFTANAKYYVYVIANAKADISNVQSLDALQALTQEDDDLHLSGLVDGAPSLFLMDGFANITGAQSASPVAVVINDGVAQNKTYLTGVLRRAAAKIILNITQGDNVQFKERIPTEGVLLGEALYSFYQLPVSTLVLTPDGSSWHNSTKVTTDDQRINNKTFTWTYVDGKPHIQIIGYAYANDWGDTEITKETSMLLNIPMLWDHDNDDSTEPESRPNSWFKVPLSKENKFERNTCYQINIRINAVGAQDKSSVIELQDIEYVTQAWITHTVTVGQNDSNPEYLMLNTDLVQIYNENVDATSLTFSSSSYIKSITLKDVYKQNSDGSFTKESDNHKAYYINKFGVTTELGSNIVSTISAVAEPGKLNGGITITSPINGSDESKDTHYNTIRYLEFEVENMTGQKATFRVMQYPVIYVTNQQGYYSYRDDFNSYYKYKGDGYVRIRLSSRNNNNFVWDGGYDYDGTAGTGNDRNNYWKNYFWQSKVVSSYNSTTGKSTTSFYSWGNTNGAMATIGGKCEDDANARMYHVRVMATSPEYTVGIPKLDAEGYTLSSEDNAKLVSPSFMIASRLGAIYSTYGGLQQVVDTQDSDKDGVPDRREIFNEHCKNYVEVYFEDADGDHTWDQGEREVHYNDWRLPTEAEIKIIISLQGTATESAPAIDYLLNGRYYMSASGPVYNDKANQSGNESAIRCIRDAY